MQESDEQRRNRELIELLNELRVALPGVQVLFAFLLAVPFQKRFPDLAHRDRVVFYLALLATALSSALMIAPSSYHRLRWRLRDKEKLLETSNRVDDRRPVLACRLDHVRRVRDLGLPLRAGRRGAGDYSARSRVCSALVRTAVQAGVA